jgi:hypothetical protein
MLTDEGIQFHLDGTKIEISFSSKPEKIRLNQISEKSINSISSDNSIGVKFQKGKILHDSSLTLTKRILLMQQNLEMAPLLKHKHLMQMSTWRLPILRDEDRDCFNHNFEINDLQQGLLNLLWQVKTKKKIKLML